MTLFARVSIGLLVIVAAAGAALALMVVMPGRSHQGPLPPLSASQRALAAELRAHVEALAQSERHLALPEGLARAETYVAAELRRAGHVVRRLPYEVEGQEVANLEVELRGPVSPDEIVVVGAHYDSAVGTPGANDNASGVAALLALARRLAAGRTARTLRLVAFVNEEPDHFRTDRMGSLVYARWLRARGERVVAMLSLEPLGYYSDAPGAQSYPFPCNLVYPSQGSFVALVGDLGSRSLVRRVTGAFRRAAQFPSEGAAAPGWIPGVGWSDHWSFWQIGVPAVVVTDTAPFRYPHYHQATDTPERIDYERLARVVEGLVVVTRELAGSPAAPSASR